MSFGRIDIILDHIENGKPYQDSLAYHFRTLIYFEQITISTSAYETLKSAGFNLIQSDELRKEIIDLFDMAYPSASNMISEISMERYGVTQSLLNKYFRVNRERTMAVPMDYSVLQQNQIFINWV